MNNKFKKEAIINMTLTDDSEFLSRFSTHDTPVISSEVAEFLENYVQRFSPRERLHLRIRDDNLDDAKKEIFALAIKDYYSDKILDIKRILRNGNFTSALLAIVGFVILAVYYMVGDSFASSILSILSWILIWEAVDFLIFKNRDLYTTRARCKAFIKMKIEFVTEKPPKK